MSFPLVHVVSMLSVSERNPTDRSSSRWIISTRSFNERPRRFSLQTIRVSPWRNARWHDSHSGRWYRKAAEQGSTWFQYELGEMYADGDGVPENYIQAYAWFSIAAANGWSSSKNEKARLTRKMTSAEISEAQKLSREYWETFGPKH